MEFQNSFQLQKQQISVQFGSEVLPRLLLLDSQGVESSTKPHKRGNPCISLYSFYFLLYFSVKTNLTTKYSS